MALFVPPSNQPSGYDVKTNTSNENVTSGEFWRVTATVNIGGAFYINDEIALEFAETTGKDDALAASATVIAATSYPRQLRLWANVGSGSQLAIRSTTGGNPTLFITNNATSSYWEGTIPAGAEVYYSHSSNTSYIYSWWAEGDTSKTATFYCKEGTPLKVAGDAYYAIDKYKNVGQ